MSMNFKKLISVTLSILLTVSLSGICPATAAEESKTPARITDIEAGLGYSMALLSDGTVWVWGDNENGLAGDGTLDQNDEDRIYNIRTRPTLVMGNVKSIGGTYDTCFAITKDNSLWGWGFNHGGRVGNGSQSDCTEPVKVLSDVKFVASGNSNHSAAIQSDGTLWTWGLNIDGQILNGSTNPQLTPRSIMKDIKTVAVGEGHTMVIKNNGDLYIWGRNWKGQLGDGTGKERLTPFKLKSNVKKVYAGSNQSYFITNDGILWGAGKDFTGRYSTPVKLLSNVTDVNASPSNYVAVKTDGTLWAWGENDRGAFGDGTTSHKYKPVKIMSNVAKAAAGDDHLLVLKKDGTLWGSGLNDCGQLGVGDTKNRTRFVQIKGFAANQAVTAVGKLQLSMPLDGNLTGWTGMDPIGSDPAGDVTAGHFDITDLYAARDEKYLYVAVKLSGSKPDIDINIDTDSDGEADYTALCYADSKDVFLDDESNKSKGHIGYLPLGYKKGMELKIPLTLMKNPADLQVSANFNKDDNGDDPNKDWMNEWFEVQ